MSSQARIDLDAEDEAIRALKGKGIELKRIESEPDIGKWKGRITWNEGDLTYTLKEVRLEIPVFPMIIPRVVDLTGRLEDENCPHLYSRRSGDGGRLLCYGSNLDEIFHKHFEYTMGVKVLQRVMTFLKCQHYFVQNEHWPRHMECPHAVKAMILFHLANGAPLSNEMPCPCGNRRPYKLCCRSKINRMFEIFTKKFLPLYGLGVFEKCEAEYRSLGKEEEHMVQSRTTDIHWGHRSYRVIVMPQVYPQIAEDFYNAICPQNLSSIKELIKSCDLRNPRAAHGIDHGSAKKGSRIMRSAYIDIIEGLEYSNFAKYVNNRAGCENRFTRIHEFIELKTAEIKKITDKRKARRSNRKKR